MTAPLTLPAIGSTNWGTAVNNNWTWLNNAFQIQASFTGTTSATSSTTGSLIVGNGTSATSVGIGGGNVYAGGIINSQYYLSSFSDITTTSGQSPFGSIGYLYASPATASTATYYANFFNCVGNSTFLSGASMSALTTQSEMTQSSSCSFGNIYGIDVNIDVINTGTGTVSATTAYGVTITPNLQAVTAAAATIVNYYALVLNAPQKSGAGSANCNGVHIMNLSQA